jgi:hypothetical protein
MPSKWQSRRHAHLILLAHAADSEACSCNASCSASGGKPRIPQDSGLGDLAGTSRHSATLRK